MIKSEQASLSVTRIALITILTIFALSVGVLAASVDVRNVKIVLSDNCEIEVFTTKTVVSDILEENHIVVLPQETVFPNINSEITDNSSRIVITGVTQDASVVATLAEEGEGIHLDQLLSTYSTVVEKILVEDEAIPYETLTKDGKVAEDTESVKIIKKGQEGLTRTTYRVKYQNDIEVERAVVKEEKISEPINQIVEKVENSAKIANTNTTNNNITNTATTNTKGTSLASKVSGMTPTKKVLNTSAYTASTCGKSPSSPSYGKTANGAQATAWYTVAAGKGYAMGTIIYIPYFANEPNGGWFVVQDRGGAITNNKLDVYMSTYNECVKFGRRNLECYIYEF